MPLSATAVAASSSRRRGVSVEARVGASVAARVGHLEWGVDQVGRDDRRVEHRVSGKSGCVWLREFRYCGGMVWVRVPWVYGMSGCVRLLRRCRTASRPR